MITADVAVRAFVFTLAVLAMTAAAALPPVAVLVVVHHRTHRPAAFWFWLVGFLVYAVVLSVGITALVINTGFVAWVGP